VIQSHPRRAILFSLAVVVMSVAAVPSVSAMAPIRTRANAVLLAAIQEKGAEPPAASSAEGAKSKESESTDEEAKFKESASVKKLAGWLGITNNQAWWLSVLINFGIILAAILYAAKSRLPGMFRDRTSAIQKGMEEARRASAESSARLADIESRLGKLDSEIAAMRASAEQEAKAEEERLRVATEDEKKKILLAADQEIAAAANLARRQLKQFAAELAVSLAEKRINVNDAADKILVRDFTRNLAAPGDGAKGRK
jgi:F-type H+-transporting ATPase subunit b